MDIWLRRLIGTVLHCGRRRSDNRLVKGWVVNAEALIIRQETQVPKGLVECARRPSRG